MFDYVQYEKTSDLDEFVDKIKLKLFCQSRVQPFIVPVMFQDDFAEVGDEYCRELTLENDSLLNAVTETTESMPLLKENSAKKYGSSSMLVTPMANMHAAG